MTGDGYYTVEATFVVTICVWVLIALCYSGFYVHDNLLLESESTERTVSWLADGGKNKAKWEKKLKKKLQNKLFLMQVYSVKAKKGLTSETVTIQYKLPVSWKKLKQMLTGGKSSLTYRVTYENIRAADYKWDYGMVEKKQEGK